MSGNSSIKDTVAEGIGSRSCSSSRSSLTTTFPSRRRGRSAGGMPSTRVLTWILPLFVVSGISDWLAVEAQYLRGGDSPDTVERWLGSGDDGGDAVKVNTNSGDSSASIHGFESKAGSVEDSNAVLQQEENVIDSEPVVKKVHNESSKQSQQQQSPPHPSQDEIPTVEVASSHQGKEDQATQSIDGHTNLNNEPESLRTDEDMDFILVQETITTQLDIAVIVAIILVGLAAMVFTAWQMTDYPDGPFAALCRFTLYAIGLLFWPLRWRSDARRYAQHVPVATMDYGFKDSSLQPF